MNEKPLNLFNTLLVMVFDCASGDDEACKTMEKLYELLELDEVEYKEGD